MSVAGQVHGPSRRRSTWIRLADAQAQYPILQVLALVGVFAYGSVSLPGLSSWPSIKTILVLAALAGLASVGQTVVVLLGGIDLSIAGFIVASALTVTTVKDKYHLPFGVALLAAIVAAGCLGALTGYLCHRFRIQPLVITLAVGAIAVGVIQVETGGAIQGSAPSWLGRLTSPATKTFEIDVPPLVVIWAVVTVIMSVFLHASVRGRRLLATGANPRAAEYSLVKTRHVWTAAFAFSAVAAVLVGLLVGGFAGSVDGKVGDPYVFQSVIAVIVGGTVFGGPGDYIRTVVGALFVTVVTTVLVGHGADQADQFIIFGLTILVAVALYGRERGFRDRI